MTGLKEFMELFGNITLGQVITWLLAIAFGIVILRKVIKYINGMHDLDQQRDAELKEALEGVRKYPEYRQKSIEVQNMLEGKIDSVAQLGSEIVERLDKMEEDRKERDRNRLRTSLLQSYRMYADTEKNPMQAWSEMEADAFWNSFSDYEHNDGDGWMHSVVQPTMNKLAVIKMDDEHNLFELMHSRKL